jgi:hypothetical protein
MSQPASNAVEYLARAILPGDPWSLAVAARDGIPAGLHSFAARHEHRGYAGCDEDGAWTVQRRTIELRTKDTGPVRVPARALLEWALLYITAPVLSELEALIAERSAAVDTLSTAIHGCGSGQPIGLASSPSTSGRGWLTHTAGGSRPKRRCGPPSPPVSPPKTLRASSSTCSPSTESLWAVGSLRAVGRVCPAHRDRAVDDDYMPKARQVLAGLQRDGRVIVRARLTPHLA